MKRDRGKGMKGGKSSDVCFPIYEYLPGNDKNEYFYLLKLENVNECSILKPRKSPYWYLNKKQYY